MDGPAGDLDAPNGPDHWAGPIGLLAALLFVQRGFDSHVFDRAAEGRKPDMVGRVGATYHHGDAAELPPGGSRLRKRTSAD
jgi:glucose dehydrogenase-like enzyme